MDEPFTREYAPRVPAHSAAQPGYLITPTAPGMAPEANTLQGVVNDTIRDLRTIHAHIDELVGQPSASEATAAELGLAEAVSTGRDLTIKALERVAALHRIIGSLG